MGEDKKDMPAFPITAGNQVYNIGMTLRDWFAGQAIVAAGIDFTAVDMQWFEQVGVKRAYRIADAMMEARKK